jgi:hypothetical protein
MGEARRQDTFFEIGLTPRIHEPCLYSNELKGKRVLFLQQVDVFAITTPDGHTADLLINLIDDRLTIPIKRQGYLNTYNGVNFIQMRDYI